MVSNINDVVTRCVKPVRCVGVCWLGIAASWSGSTIIGVRGGVVWYECYVVTCYLVVTLVERSSGW